MFRLFLLNQNQLATHQHHYHEKPNFQFLHRCEQTDYYSTPGVEAADFYAMSLDDSSCFTAPPIMLGDFKPSNIKRAYEETVAYIVRVAEKTTNYFGLFLGLALTNSIANLLVCVSLHNKMYVIKMFSGVQVANFKAFRNFFALVCAAVCSLQKKPIKINPVLSDVLPLSEGYFTSTAKGIQRVFFHRNKVYKIFDYSDDNHKSLAPNVEAIETIGKGYLPELKLVQLSSDGTFQRLEYTFLEGEHKPKKVKQFLSILQALQQLHDTLVTGESRKDVLPYCF